MNNLVINTPVSNLFTNLNLVFDVGANVGNKTEEYLAYGVKRVICIEPQRDLADSLFQRFYREIEEKKIEILPIALGKEDSVLKLYPSNANTIATMSQKFQTGRFKDQGYKWFDPVDVTVKPVKKVIDEYGRPDYMKVDVEGFEYDVMSGLSDKQEKLPKIISFEYTEEFFDECEKVINLLFIKGYTKYNLSLAESGLFTINWCSKEQLIAHLKWLQRGQLLWGDIYVTM